METIKEKVRTFLDQYGILENTTPVLVAFSGGYDSMCLLDIVGKFTDNVVAIHLNHNWRGEESDKEELNCRKFCENNNIKFYSEKLSKDVKKTETAARETRYKFFERCAEKFNSNIILTAHNANDNAETLIYRISKGTGLKGLCGIAENRNIFYRPLLNIKRDEIENYCTQNNLTPNNDSSNENTKYKRNLIRKNIIPQMEQITPSAIDMINSLSKNAQIDVEIIEEYLKTLKNPYKTKNFLSYSPALQTRLIYELFDKNGLEIDKDKIKRAMNFIEENKTSKSGKTLSVSEKFYLFISEKEIKFIARTDKLNFKVEIKEEGEYATPNGKFCIEKCNQKPDKFPEDEELKAYVNLSEYKRLTLRTRKEGDIIKPLGISGRQKLKKYLNEKKIPAHKKADMIFLASEAEILWAPGLGISDNIKVVTSPTHVLKLVIEEK